MEEQPGPKIIVGKKKPNTLAINSQIKYNFLLKKKIVTLNISSLLEFLISF